MAAVVQAVEQLRADVELAAPVAGHAAVMRELVEQ